MSPLADAAVLPGLASALASLLPVACMLLAALAALGLRRREGLAWRVFHLGSALAVAAALASLALLQVAPALGLLTAPAAAGQLLPAWWLALPLAATPLVAWMALLVQGLGSVIGAFSARQLQGEPGQGRFVAALAGVLAAVQLLLLADHWLLLIAAWAAVGVLLERLLCFYAERPFARLAAHKKRLADRLADVLLLCAAALAWQAVGSGSLSALAERLATGPASPALQASAVLLVLAVALRCALLPMHGWLIQVMEAPTPVSALLHAGVVNLGGIVLIRLAPLLEASFTARSLLVVLGAATALLAGLAMLTRISIKVRLAWSTVAQMGFLAMECGLGLYTLAVLHLVGHSVYKAHAFLSAGDTVRQTRLRLLQAPAGPAAASVLLAPLLALAVVAAVQLAWAGAAWPWWWSLVLGLAWAPLLWWPAEGPAGAAWRRAAGGLLAVALMSLAALAAHALVPAPADATDTRLGLVALGAMALLSAVVALLQLRPQALAVPWRWSYAGFHLDEPVTRLVLALWPSGWMPRPARAARPGRGPAWTNA